MIGGISALGAVAKWSGPRWRSTVGKRLVRRKSRSGIPIQQRPARILCAASQSTCEAKSALRRRKNMVKLRRGLAVAVRYLGDPLWKPFPDLWLQRSEKGCVSRVVIANFVVERRYTLLMMEWVNALSLKLYLPQELPEHFKLICKAKEGWTKKTPV